MPDPAITDIPIIQPAPRQFSTEALQSHMAILSQYAGLGGTLSRQHRAVLLALRALPASAGAIEELELTASGSYTQAEIQSIADKLDTLIVAVNALNANIDALIAATNTLIVSPQDAG